MRNYKKTYEGNPSRQERMKSFLNGKLIKRIERHGEYYIWLKLNKYYGVSFSLDRKSKLPHPDSFHPYNDTFDFSHILEDYDHNGDLVKYEIID